MIFIFDSHPVQYKAPIYQRLQKIRPNSFRVIYATDVTLRGHLDREFQVEVSWDTPLLEGYDHKVMDNENGTPFQGYRSLSGRGVKELLEKERPQAALISQFLYAYDWAAFRTCLRLGIPLWIRHETQDEAFSRPLWKTALRSLFYRAAYRGVSHAFYIGELNREHLLRHGIRSAKLSRAAYCTAAASDIDPKQMTARRSAVRERYKIRDDETVLLFSGKLIDKKNPALILDAWERLTEDERKSFVMIFVGAGPLEESLRRRAAAWPGRIHFAGFINQREIRDFYAAADILLLPSRRAGETWGLVVNEALQAGCGVVMTKAVGSHREFGDWERVRVTEENDAVGLAEACRQLAKFPRSFDWCSDEMKTYSVEAAADAIAERIDLLD